MKSMIFLLLVLFLAAAMAADLAIRKNGDPKGRNRKILIKMRFKDGKTLEDTTPIKNAFLRAVPGISPNHIVIGVRSGPNKRITYNIFIEIVGSSVDIMETALDPQNFSKTVAAISHEVAKIEDVYETIDISIVEASPLATVENNPIVDQTPMIGIPVSPQDGIRSISIQLFTIDGAQFPGADAIKSALVSAIPGLRSEDVTVQITLVSKKRAEYQVIITISGLSVEVIDGAFHADNYSSTMNTISAAIAEVPGASSIGLVGISGVAPSVASPVAPIPIQPPTAPPAEPILSPSARSPHHSQASHHNAASLLGLGLVLFVIATFMSQ